jgi:hypothetical protein
MEPPVLALIRVLPTAEGRLKKGGEMEPVGGSYRERAERRSGEQRLQP